MRIFRFLLTVMILPVLLVMKVLILLCLFLTAISSGLSSLMGMLALVSMFLIPMKSALILLVSAWLISPAGFPLIAQKLLEVLYAGCERMQDWVMG